MASFLGIGGLDHNGSIAVGTNGKIKTFFELERLTRLKNVGISNPEHLEVILSALEEDDIVHIAIADIEWWSSYKDWMEPILKQKFPRVTISVHHHHHCHLSAAFHLSPFEEAISIAVDGKGDGMSTSWGIGRRGSGVEIKGGQSSWYSLGRMWWAVSEALGFPGHHSAGKTMAFAALGNAKGHIQSCLVLEKEGTFSFKHPDLIAEDWRNVKKITSLMESWIAKDPKLRPADLAVDIQNITEKIILHLTTYAINKSGIHNVCIAGGVALNGISNQALHCLQGVKSLFVPPVTDDRGLSIGAICEVMDRHYGGTLPLSRCSPYLGLIYPSNRNIQPSLKLFKKISIGSKALEQSAQIIREGGVMAWHQGRSEAGPRALCHRSLLSTPTDRKLADRINSELKHREWFRPFGCSILETETENWLEMEGDSPYMLRIVPVRKNKMEMIPGALHLDGTTRPHVVNRNELPELCEMIDYLVNNNHPPMVLNTSLNLRGEPLSETYEDTFRIAVVMNLDAVFVDGTLFINTNMDKSLPQDEAGLL